MPAYLDGLLSEVVDGSRCSYLELVRDHVAQTLVVDDPEVDVGVELGASDATVHDLIAIVVVAGRFELLTKVVHCAMLFVEPSRRNRDEDMIKINK